MAVIVGPGFQILQPLLELAKMADLEWRQPSARFDDFLTEVSVDIQNLRG